MKVHKGNFYRVTENGALLFDSGTKIIASRVSRAMKVQMTQKRVRKSRRKMRHERLKNGRMNK